MMVRLGEICTIVSGTTPKSTQPEYWDGDLNWVTPAELTDESDIIYESQRKITQQAVNDSSLKFISGRNRTTFLEGSYWESGDCWNRNVQ